MENKDVYPKPTGKLLSKINSIIKLQWSLLRLILVLLKDSDPGFELRTNEEKELKKRLDVFESKI
jgi:hypothetical protein